MDKYMNKRDMAERIVCEVKSHGLFDEFRRECMADVDTKPAYQNLRHRVVTTVQAYLKEQKRTPETNKLQLREKLRRHINDKGFLETGVGRIVDQVVNPKINSTFLPKIEDLAYKYMNIEKPKERRMKAIKVDTTQLGFLPNLDLEQVSPDSASKSPVDDLNAGGDDGKGLHESDDKTLDEFESPAFEPVECSKVDGAQEQEDTCIDMDIAVSNDTDYGSKAEPIETAIGEDRPLPDGLHNDDAKSNLSSISGLTSNGSTNGGEEPTIDGTGTVKDNSEISAPERHEEPMAEIETETISGDVPMDELSVTHVDVGSAAVPVDAPSNNESNDNVDVNQDCALSRISNNSRLSVSIGNTDTGIQDDETVPTSDSIGVNNSGDGAKIEKSIRDMTLCDIDEEAQMQKFNESSSSNNSSNVDKDIDSSGNSMGEHEAAKPVTSFETSFIKKDEIKFESPERKAFGAFSIANNAEKEAEKVAEECLTPTNSKFEPSSFHVKPVEVSCADLNVDDVRTSISDCFDTTSQSNSNNLVIIENEDMTAKSLEPPSISPTTNESTAAPSTDGKRSSRDKSSERRHEASKSRSKGRSGDNKHSVSRSSDRSGNPERPNSAASSKERSHSNSQSRDKSRKSSSSHSTSSRRHSRSRDRAKEKDRSKNSQGHESSSRKREESSSCRREGSSTSSKEKLSSDKSKSNTDKAGSSSHHKDSKRERNHSSRTSESERTKDRPSSSASQRSKEDSGNSSRSHHSGKKSSDEKRDVRHRSDRRKSSSRKEDDHSSHRTKPSSRQRSRSKDSNEGSAQPGRSGSSNNSKGTVNQSAGENESKADQGQNNSDTTRVPIESLRTGPEPSDTENCSMELDIGEPSPPPYSPVGPPANADSDGAEDFVLLTKPVVVDQILSGSEINLETFIDSQQQNRDDPIISQIEQTLKSQVKIKKPKTAKNMREAQKLTKLYKRKEHDEQKKIEKAMVLAKQYLRTNASAEPDELQGVELEFACGGEASGVQVKGPKISSPVKLIDAKDRTPATDVVVDKVLIIQTESDPNTPADQNHPEAMRSVIVKTEDSAPVLEMTRTTAQQPTANVVVDEVLINEAECVPEVPTDQCKAEGELAVLVKTDDSMPYSPSEFRGFDDCDVADVVLKLSAMDRLKEEQLFLMNNQLSSAKVKSAVQKRRQTTVNAPLPAAKRSRMHSWAASAEPDDPENKHIKVNFGLKNPELFLAKVIISKTNTSAHIKLKGPSPNADELVDTDIIDLSFCLNSGEAKANKKTRYSNDELFKPRPHISGSRSRRRGVNCDD